MTFRNWHRMSGLVLAAFLLAHLGNHAVLFLGPEVHLRVQGMLRIIYRHPLVEPLILIAAATQIITGLRMLWRRGWPRLFWQQVQSLSGFLLAFFMVQHILAALITRAFKPDVDTNIYWAASVVSRVEFALYFAPYYAIGVASLTLHFAAFLALRHRRVALAGVVAMVGTAWAILLVAALSGAFFVIELPPANIAYLDTFWSLSAP